MAPDISGVQVKKILDLQLTNLEAEEDDVTTGEGGDGKDDDDHLRHLHQLKSMRDDADKKGSGKASHADKSSAAYKKSLDDTVGRVLDASRAITGNRLTPSRLPVTSTDGDTNEVQVEDDSCSEDSRSSKSGRRSTAGQQWKKFLSRTSKARERRVDGDLQLAMRRTAIEERDHEAKRKRDDEVQQVELDRKRMLTTVEIEERRAAIEEKRVQTHIQSAQLQLIQQLLIRTGESGSKKP